VSSCLLRSPASSLQTDRPASRAARGAGPVRQQAQRSEGSIHGSIHIHDDRLWRRWLAPAASSWWPGQPLINEYARPLTQARPDDDIWNSILRMLCPFSPPTREARDAAPTLGLWQARVCLCASVPVRPQWEHPLTHRGNTTTDLPITTTTTDSSMTSNTQRGFTEAVC
jgi:hypothetical protein